MKILTIAVSYITKKKNLFPMYHSYYDEYFIDNKRERKKINKESLIIKKIKYFLISKYVDSFVLNFPMNENFHLLTPRSLFILLCGGFLECTFLYFPNKNNIKQTNKKKIIK